MFFPKIMKGNIKTKGTEGLGVYCDANSHCNLTQIEVLFSEKFHTSYERLKEMNNI